MVTAEETAGDMDEATAIESVSVVDELSIDVLED